jgi:hypothetical protein
MISHHHLHHLSSQSSILQAHRIRLAIMIIFAFTPTLFVQIAKKNEFPVQPAQSHTDKITD